MPADPVRDAYTYRVYVRAHYIDTLDPLYNTLYISRAGRPATEEDLNVAVGLIDLYLNQYYRATCADDVIFDTTIVRTLDNPSQILFEGPEWRNPQGGGGTGTVRAMALNIQVSPLGSYGRSQKNRVQTFGIPQDATPGAGSFPYDAAFVAKRLKWLQRVRDDPGMNHMFLAVYSPLTRATYVAFHIVEVGPAGQRNSRRPGHKKR